MQLIRGFKYRWQLTLLAGLGVFHGAKLLSVISTETELILLAVFALILAPALVWTRRAALPFRGARKVECQTKSNVAKAWQKKPEQIFAKLSSRSSGLSSIEAKARMAKYGPNVLEKGEQESFSHKVLSSFFEGMNRLLIAAAVVIFISNVATGEKNPYEPVFILAILLTMTILEVFMDFKQDQAMEKLAAMANNFNVKAIRDGKETEIPLGEVVPGDVVLAHPGDIIAGDGRIFEIEGDAFADESILTGEAEPVAKTVAALDPDELAVGDQKNLVHSNTFLVAGVVKYVVFDTAMTTELGRIAQTLAEVEDEPTPLDKFLEKLSEAILRGCFGLLFVLTVFNIFVRGMNPILAIAVASAIAVAAVPSSLPSVKVSILSVATQTMAKRNALVRKLNAVMSASAITYLFMDKTGTVTLGKMTLTEVFNGAWHPAKNAVETAIWYPLERILKNCTAGLNPTDKAVAAFFKEIGADGDLLRRLKEYTFDSAIKRMSVIVEMPSGEILALTKGSESILELCRLSSERRAELVQIIKQKAKEGLRVLVLAEKKLQGFDENTARDQVESDLDFVGLVALQDPPKLEVGEAIRELRRAGIHVAMVTGDHLETARAIAMKIGLFGGKGVISGDELESWYDSGQYQKLLGYSVYARVSPTQKNMLIDAVRRSGEYCGFVGDGLNDAPALRNADVGFCMASGAPVAQSASDILLMDNNFATTVVAVEEARGAYERLRIAINYLISCNVAEIGIYIVASFLGLPLPLTIMSLLLMNVATDALPAMAMGFERGMKNLLESGPRTSQNIFDAGMAFNIINMTVISTIVVSFGFWLAYGYVVIPGLNSSWSFSLPVAQTMGFYTLCAIELLRAYTARSVETPLLKLGINSNRFTHVAVAIGFALTLGAIYLPVNFIFGNVPLTLDQILAGTAVALIGPVWEEISKLTFIPVIDRMFPSTRSKTVASPATVTV